MADVSTLTDTFATLDGAKWTTTGTVVASGGVLDITPSSAYTFCTSVNTYTLIGNGAFIEVPQLAAGSAPEFDTEFSVQLDASNQLQIIHENGTLYFRSKVAGANSDVTIAYNATSHRWWRITESGGSVQWWTSSDGSNWTSRRTLANPFTLTAIKVVLDSGWWSGGSPTITAHAQFDNLNVQTVVGLTATSAGTASTSGTLAKSVPLAGTSTGASTTSGGLAEGGGSSGVYGTAVYGTAVYGQAGGGAQALTGTSAGASITGGGAATGYKAEVIADSPTSYWRLGEPSGTNANDEVSTNDGTYTNTPTLGVTGALSGSTDTAITLDGTQSEYVDIPNLGLGTNATMEAWFKTTAATGSIFSARKSTGEYIDIMLSGGRLKGEAYDGSAFTHVDGPFGKDDGNWHHVALVKTGTGLELFVDGSSAATGSLGTSFTVDDMDIGRRPNGINYFTGSIDEVAVYPAALTGTRIAAHFNAAGTAESAGATQLSVTRGLSATSAGTATTTGNLTATWTLTGTSTSTAATSGTPNVAHPLTGTSTGTSTTSGDLMLVKPLDGTTTGTSSTTGSIRATFALAGTSTGAATTSGDARAAWPLTGTTAGTATTTGSAVIAVSLTGTSAGSSSTSGNLTVQNASAGALAGTSTGASSTSGNLRATFTLAATSAGASTTTGLLGVPAALTGTSTGAATTSGSLLLVRSLTGTSAGASTTIGSLLVVIGLTGTTAGAATTTGALRSAWTLTGTSAGVGLTAGDLAALLAPRGSIEGSGGTTGVEGAGGIATTSIEGSAGAVLVGG